MMPTITGLCGRYDKLNNQERLSLVADAPVDIRGRLETVADNISGKELPAEYLSWYYNLFAHCWLGNKVVKK